MRLPETVALPAEFALRVAASGLMFIIIASVAAGLHLYLATLYANGMLGEEFSPILKWLEYGGKSEQPPGSGLI